MKLIRVGAGLRGLDEDSSGLECECGLNRGAAATFQSLHELEFHRSASHAAQTGNIEKLKRVIKANPSAVHGDTTGNGYTPLLYAARAGHLNVCILLIDSGADINAKTKGGATALHRAASGGHSEVVQLLVQKGADGLIADTDHETPAHKAATAGHGSLARFLLRTFPASASVVNRHGKTPMSLLAGSGGPSFDTWKDAGPQLLLEGGLEGSVIV